MKTITLTRHFWSSFRYHPIARPEEAATHYVPVKDTKPRAPSKPLEERFWAIGSKKLLGIPLPNAYQSLFFLGLCTLLSLPVFLLDKTGRPITHGFMTLGSLAAFSAFCWIVGMLMASTASGPPKS